MTARARVASVLVGAVALLVPTLAAAAPGDLDRSFGDHGRVRKHLGEGHSYAYDLALDRHGRIVVAGSDGDGLLARFRRDGRLDRSFGRRGVVKLDSVDYAGTVAIDSRGRLVILGGSTTDGTGTLARFKPSGALDDSFGSHGVRETIVGALALTIDARDRIVTAGGSGDDFAIARYEGNGKPDDSFGSDGVVTTDFGGDAGEYALAVATDSQRRIVAAGTSCDYDSVAHDPALCSFAVARYLPGGAGDDSFAGDGKALTDFGGGYDFDHASSVAVDSRDRVVAAGGSGDSSGSGRGFALARYRQDGQLDPSFGGDGKAFTRFRDHHHDAASSVAIDSRGRIVAVGGYDHSALARFGRNGTLDRSFGGDGKVVPPFSGYDSFSSVVTDSRDRVVAAGASSGAVLLARFVGYRRR